MDSPLSSTRSTFGTVLAREAHFTSAAVGPIAGQAVAAAPTGAGEAGVTHCLTVVAEEALRADTQVGAPVVLAAAAVLAGAGVTGIHLCLAADSCEAWGALADKGPSETPAGASVSAGLHPACVCLQLTVGALVAWAADAQVPSDAVLAGAPMQARLGSALVDFVALGRLAPDALWLADPDAVGGTEAVAAVTRVHGHRAHPGAVEAQGGVFHLLGGPAVHLCLAPASRVPCLAAAGEICAQVLAGTPIHTRAPEAGGGGYLTVPPGEAWGTVTLVFADVVEAGATVVTGARGARVWLPDLAVPPGEGVGAGAVVLAARLLARAAVLARP